jgi:hypothetical protein
MELLNLLWLVAIAVTAVWILSKLLKGPNGGGHGDGGGDYALWGGMAHETGWGESDSGSSAD